jgi:hypothetical protein
MRTIILLTLLTISFMSCSDKNEKFNDIDFIGYYYKRVESKNPLFNEERRLISPFYIHIDNRYNCQLISERTFDIPGIYYLATNSKEPGLKGIVDRIVDKSINLQTDLDLRLKRPALCDGIDLRIRITYDKHTREIHFWQGMENSKVYEELYSFAYQMFEKNNAKFLVNNPVLEKRRVDFIGYIETSDSLKGEVPPLPPKDVVPKYIPPIVVDSL